MIKKNFIKKWEVSILKIIEDNKVVYKITKRLPFFSVSQIKFFDNKQKVEKQFKEWSN